MASTLIVDTGFWVALQLPRDRWHPQAQRAARLFSHYQPVTTWPVVTEAAHLIANFGGGAGAARFLELMASGIASIHDLPAKELPVLAKLLRKYSWLPMDFADASLVWLANEEGHGRILSTDERDFGVYRFKNTPPFENHFFMPDAP